MPACLFVFVFVYSCLSLFYLCLSVAILWTVCPLFVSEKMCIPPISAYHTIFIPYLQIKCTYRAKSGKSSRTNCSYRSEAIGKYGTDKQANYRRKTNQQTSKLTEQKIDRKSAIELNNNLLI